MSLKASCWCGVKAFNSEAAARSHWTRIESRGVSPEVPTGVRECGAGRWHLVYDAKPVGLKATSAKRDKENRERQAMVLELWPDRTPRCVVLDCTRLADDVHEPLTRARGGSITDPENAAPICRPHHSELDSEPAWAYEQGLLLHSWDASDVAKAAEKRRSLLQEAS